MFGTFHGNGQGDLMGAECALDLQSVDDRGSGPALRRVENDQWPTRAHRLPVLSCRALNLPDLLHGLVKCRGHCLVHEVRFVTLYEERRPTAAAQELFQLLAADAGEDGWVGNLVAVEVQD